MKHLTITYSTGPDSAVTLFDGEIDELVWVDSDNEVKIQGRRIPKKAAGGSNILELLSSASKARNATPITTNGSEVVASE